MLYLPFKYSMHKYITIHKSHYIKHIKNWLLQTAYQPKGPVL